MRKVFFILAIFHCGLNPLKAQVLDYDSKYYYADFFIKKIIFKSIYTSQEELFKTLKVKNVFLTGERKKYFINRAGKIEKIKMKNWNFSYNSGPSLFEIEFTKQEHHQPLNNERINEEDYVYDKEGRLKSITSSFPYYNDMFRNKSDNRRVSFFYHDSLLIGSRENGVHYYTYNDAGLVSAKYIIYGEKKDTSIVYFLYDENQKLTFITSKNDTLQRIYYSGDTISILNIKNWREEYIIKKNKLVKFTQIFNDFPNITEEYFYRSDGLPDKLIRAYKNKSSNHSDSKEYDYEYEYYSD